jgi:tetratricopeptide (TPR) repeat protein
LLPKEDVFRRSKALEYLGDMSMSNMDYKSATEIYTQTLDYQQQILSGIRERMGQILEIRRDIIDIKASLLRERDFVKYNEFQARERNRAAVESEKQQQDYVYRKLNPGKVRWNMAIAHERMGQLDKAVEYYREAVRFDYRAVEARRNITKIQLKSRVGVVLKDCPSCPAGSAARKSGIRNFFCRGLYVRS